MIKEQASAYGASITRPDVHKVYGTFSIDLGLHTPVVRAIKRVVDVCGSLLGLLFGWPFLVVIAFLIIIDSPGPPIYRQWRIGYGGRKFRIWKFRTMFVDGEVLLWSRLAADAGLMNEYVHYQKLRQDPRLTRLGGFLRRYSLDELPQLWNVLIGEMSLVGPRPFTPDQEPAYAGVGQAYNHYVHSRPGLTGWWQVSGRNTTSFEERVSLDMEYFRNWTFWLDCLIIFRTLKVVLRGEGAY